MQPPQLTTAANTPPRRPRFASLLPDITPLREYRSYRLLWIGNLVSTSGTQLRLVAVPYQIYLLTGSTLAVGLVGLFQAIPLLAFSLFGGVLADRYDRRRLLLLTQIGLSLTSTALAIATQAGVASLPLIYALTALGAAFSAIDGPARGALTPTLIERRRDLPAAMALQQMVFQSAGVIGPAAAGVVLLTAGVAGAYAIDAITFIAAILAVLAIKAPRREAVARVPVVRSLLEGYDYLRTNPLLFSTMSLDFLAMLFGSTRALFPYFADRVFAVGPQGLGLMYAAPGLGAVVASITSGWVSGVRRQGLAVMISVIVWGGAIAAFGLIGPSAFALGLFLLAISEGADVISAVFRSTIMQTVVPDRLRGRIVSVNRMFVVGGPQIGQVQSGLLATLLTPEIAVVAGGVICIAIVGALAVATPELVAYVPAREDDPI